MCRSLIACLFFLLAVLVCKAIAVRTLAPHVPGVSAMVVVRH